MAAGVRSFIQGPPPAGGPQVETEEFSVSGQQVHRQITQVGGRDSDALAQVLNANPAPSEFGLVVRLAISEETPLVPNSAAVGVASGTIVATNVGRRSLTILNTSISGQRISLGFGFTASLDAGITLQPGDSYSMGPREFHTGTIDAIASAASGQVAIQEWNQN